MQSERFTQPVKDQLLGFQAPAGCDTTLVFGGRGTGRCWKMLQNHLHFCRVVLENSHHLNNLCVTCMSHLSSQPSTMPGSNHSIRSRLVWGCYLKTEALWNFTPHAPTSGGPGALIIPSSINISAWTMKSDCLKAPGQDYRVPPIPDVGLELGTCQCR